MSYCGQENAKSGLTVEDDKKGNLKVTYTSNVATDAFNNYSTTRLVRLTFESVEADSDQNAEFAFADVNIDASTNKKNAEGATVKLVGRGTWTSTATASSAPVTWLWQRPQTRPRPSPRRRPSTPISTRWSLPWTRRHLL